MRTITSVYVFTTRTAKHKRYLKNQLSFMMNLYRHVVQCFSIKYKKRHNKYCVSRAKLFTSGPSGDVELNPGAVVTHDREIIQTIVLNCYLISTTWLENIRCFWCR